MITAFYASILALFMCWLSMQVIKARRKYQVRYADGGVKPVIIARTAQQNAFEYIPISLILMALLEYNSQLFWLVHLLGVLLCIARITHARAILTRYHAGRVMGMKLTFSANSFISDIKFVVYSLFDIYVSEAYRFAYRSSLFNLPADRFSSTHWHKLFTRIFK